MAKKPKSTKAETRPKAEQKSKKNERLPLLLDFTLTLSKFCVGIIGGLAALISILAGNSLWTAALRSGAAMGITGLVLWIFNWFLLRRALEVAVIEMAKQADEASHSTISRRV